MKDYYCEGALWLYECVKVQENNDVIDNGETKERKRKRWAGMLGCS